MRFVTLIVLFVGIASSTLAQELPLIPYPKEITRAKGEFRFTSSTSLVFNGSTSAFRTAIEPLLQQLKTAAGIQLVTRKVGGSSTVVVSPLPDAGVQGAYQLSATPGRIDVRVNDAAGLFYATQTLLQLLPPAIERNELVKGISWSVPAVRIADEPALAYRGLMVDVSRHFQPVSFLKKLVDLMAMQKMNNLHLHLTDDQGWRMEIRKYPALTEKGAYRNGTIIGKYPGTGSDNTRYGGYYTQQELKELVAYAQKRFVTIVPEIELPGHSSAMIAAYPQLSCFPSESTVEQPAMMADLTRQQVKQPGTKVVQETWGVFNDVICPTDYTFQFIRDVLDEVISVFPSPYIHIGGDECPKDAWKRSAFCQQLIREKGLKDEHGLQSYIIQTVEKYINSKGRRIIGWDEILEGGLAPDATVMSWRGVSGGIESAKQKHDVIMSPDSHLYLNFYQSDDPQDSIAWGGYLPLRRVYEYDPIPSELNADEIKYIKGVQGNLWTEYVKSAALAEYMLFPRILALAEVGWRKEKTGFEHFSKRVIGHLPRLSNRQVHYSRHLFEIGIKGTPDPAARRIQVQIAGVPAGQQIRFRINGGAKQIYTGPFLIDSSAEVEALVEQGGQVLDRNTARFQINKATGASVRLQEPPSTPYDKGGAAVLVNGIQGNAGRFSDPEWLGFNGKDAELYLDLGKSQQINQINLRLYHSPGSWIRAPREIYVWVSEDGKQFSEPVKITVTPVKDGVIEVERALRQVSARYVKISAKQHGIIAAGEPGAGYPAWLFIDEISLH